MKIIVTGSLGNISKPLTIELVKKGHQVTVISTKPEKQKEIETLGATATIGSIDDVNFLTVTFKGADIVYSILTNDISSFFDPNTDFIALMNKIGNNYKQAIENSGVKRLVHLSSIGAHTDQGNGILRFHYNVENILKQLPDDVSIKFMRPVGFFTNLFRSLQTIKTNSAFVFNYGGDKKEPWVSPLDIAAVISEEIEKTFNGRTVRYIASDEISPNEIAKTLGEAIGKPELKWLAIPSEELLKGMLTVGMNEQIAKGFVEMYTSQGSGLLYEDYYRHKPILGKVKLTDFAKDFTKVFNQ